MYIKVIFMKKRPHLNFCNGIWSNSFPIKSLSLIKINRITHLRRMCKDIVFKISKTNNQQTPQCQDKVDFQRNPHIQPS